MVVAAGDDHAMEGGEDKPEARSQKPEEKAKAEVESQKPEEKTKAESGSVAVRTPEECQKVAGASSEAKTPGSAPPAHPSARAKRAAHPGGVPEIASQAPRIIPNSGAPTW
jgi:hypothetical protein